MNNTINIKKDEIVKYARICADIDMVTEYSNSNYIYFVMNLRLCGYRGIIESCRGVLDTNTGMIYKKIRLCPISVKNRNIKENELKYTSSSGRIVVCDKDVVYNNLPKNKCKNSVEEYISDNVEEVKNMLIEAYAETILE